MKKYLLLGLALVALSGAFALTDSAAHDYSQYPYLQHLSVDPKIRYDGGTTVQQNLRTRPFSNRIGSFKYRTKTRNKMPRVYVPSPVHGWRTDVWYHNQYRETDVSDLARQRALKKYWALKNNPRHENTLFTGRIITNGDHYKTYEHPLTRSLAGVNTNNTHMASQLPAIQELYPYEFKTTPVSQSQTVTDQEILFDLPNGFSKDGSMYKAAGTSLAFRVVRTPEAYSCDIDFKMCAITLGKGFRSGQNLSNAGFVKQNYMLKQTVGHTFSYFPTYIETYDAYGFGTRNVYYTFNALDPNDNSVVRIEAVSLVGDANQASKIMNEIFETFRFQS